MPARYVAPYSATGASKEGDLAVSTSATGKATSTRRKAKGKGKEKEKEKDKDDKERDKNDIGPDNPVVCFVIVFRCLIADENLADTTIP